MKCCHFSGMALCCCVMFLLTILLESLKLLNLYLIREGNKSPLVYAKTEQNINSRDPLVVPLLIPASLCQWRTRRWAQVPSHYSHWTTMYLRWLSAKIFEQTLIFEGFCICWLEAQSTSFSSFLVTSWCWPSWLTTQTSSLPSYSVRALTHAASTEHLHPFNLHILFF